MLSANGLGGHNSMTKRPVQGVGDRWCATWQIQRPWWRRKRGRHRRHMWRWADMDIWAHEGKDNHSSVVPASDDGAEGDDNSEMMNAAIDTRWYRWRISLLASAPLNPVLVYGQAMLLTWSVFQCWLLRIWDMNQKIINIIMLWCNAVPFLICTLQNVFIELNFQLVFSFPLLAFLPERDCPGTFRNSEIDQGHIKI